MATDAAIAKTQRLFTIVNIAFALIISVLVAREIGGVAARTETARLRANAQETQNVQTESLTGLLDKYRLLTVLLSHQSDVIRVFSSPETEDVLETARRLVSRAMAESGALDFALIYPDGSLLIAARDQDDYQVVPVSIEAALQGRLGREMRVGKNGKRAYVFTKDVRLEGELVGVVAIYVDFEDVEARWSLSTLPIMAVNDRGTVVISNQVSWRLKSITEVGLPDEVLSQPSGMTIFLRDGDVSTRVIKTNRKLPTLGWELIVLTDISSARFIAILWAGFAVSIFIGVALGIQFYINRHFALVRQSHSDRALSLHLERLVQDRTKQLSDANVSLENEIEVHKETDAHLRKAQKDLIQTGKLAALGQMSAALSHEFNQPLSAVKSYANNANTLLARGRDAEARENINHISDLTDRMAKISRHLRNFARKPNTSYGSVLASSVIDDALRMVSSRVREQNAEVIVEKGAPDIWVRAGHVRLQQVLVNLILNALDAMANMDVPRIQITINLENDKVCIRVRDWGTGISDEVLTHIFDPFYTTKEVGKGMGLGLSISFNIVKDFEGELLVHNVAEGGAEFIIVLLTGERPSGISNEVQS